VKVLAAQLLTFFCRSGFCKIRLGYKEKNFFPFVKIAVMDSSEFLGLIGGILGLIAGVSAISVVELLYHLVSGVFAKRFASMKVEPLHEHPRRRSFLSVESRNPWRKLLKSLVDFTKQSSIHGLSYITNEQQNLTGAVLWLLIVASAFLCCLISLTHSVTHSVDNPILLGIDEKLWTLRDVSGKEWRGIRLISKYLTDSVSNGGLLSQHGL
jgi:Amiloride-sensitive sodium channel